MNVTSQTELDTLLSSTSKLVVVHFHAPTDLGQIEVELDHVTFVRVDVEAVEALAKHVSYNITTTPTFVFFNRKEAVETIEGHDIGRLTEALYKHKPQDEPTKDEVSKTESTTPNPTVEPSPQVVLPTKVLDSMWNSDALANANSKALPAPRHLDDMLSQLRITFLPKTQRKAVHVVEGVPLVEPTLALFCPIEGGEYVVDATVKELARKTGADVQVVDMAHVAAGEWGNFGKLASGFRLKNNPLGKVGPVEELDNDDDDTKNLEALESFWRAVVESDPPVPATSEKEPPSVEPASGEESSSTEPASTEPASTEPASTEPTPTEPPSTEPVSAELAPAEAVSTESESPKPASSEPTSPAKRPRIIYIRDFGILCARSHTWFPPLYTAIRARRTGGAGPDSPIANPTTVVFGVSPRVSSLIPSLTEGGGCQCSSCRPSAKQWDEDATKERAKRLKGLKEKWDKGTLIKDLPAFKPTVKIPKDKKDAKDESTDKVDSEAETKDEAKDEAKDAAKEETKDEAKDEAKDETKSKDDSSESTSDSESSTSDDDSTHEQKLDGYFRACIVAPATRSAKLERAAREKRRRELNELMLRMMVGVKGGDIASGAAPVSEEDGDLVKGWNERLLESDALKDVVDRALGMAMLSDEGEEEQDRISVTWTQLQDAWRAKNGNDEERKAWTSADGSDDESEEKDEKEEEEKPPVDEVVEKVKAADLDEHEQRLVGCIVDVVKIPTTFENVHLPMQVIDSVRSIVSLPLLFPDAFKSGILKQQAISGALLFGPPGTGKTLVVRALAKESGARMLAIKPSDIADKWVGETEKLVKSLFKLARRLKPCVVFIDEIDSIMGSRQSKACGGGARWHTSMLTEFMQEMDGLMASSVIVIGATNRPFDIDDAVLRRLPCRLLVDLPGERAREEILKIMLRDDKLAPDVSVSDLAKKTDRFSGSDLKHLCVAAAMDALKESVKLPWATKKEESKDAPDTNATPTADATAAKPAANGTTEPEKDATKPASSDASDDDSSRSSSEPSSGSSTPPSSGITTPGEESPKAEPEPPKPRLLEARHFTRALMDVAPSSSESQGSLSELRKWNTQFGTGARDQPQTRTAGSLPYSKAGTGLGGVNRGNGPPNYGGLGSSGLGSGAGLGSTGLGASGFGLGSGLGSSGLGSSGFGSSGLGSSGFGTSGPGYGAAGGGYTPTYASPSAGGAPASTGLTPKFPVYTRNIPGYNPSAPGDGFSAPGL